jgi:chromosome segregation ATPase
MDVVGFILFGVAAVAAVIFFMLRKQDAVRADEASARAERLEKELTQLKSDTSGRKDTLESRTKELAEAKEKLRDAKKRLHEEKETHRKQEIDTARAEGEREGQAQVAAARQQAAEAQMEIKRLQAELEQLRSRKPARAPEAKVAEVKVDLTAPQAPAEPAAPAEPSKPRELTKVEQDRIALLERQAVKQAEKLKQVELDAQRAQRRADSTDKAYKVLKSELDVAKAKSTGHEKRLNKTLLELDKLRQRAFKAGLVNEIVAAQAEAAAETDAAEKQPITTSPADTVLPPPEAKA